MFMAAVIALLAGVCYVFPQGRASIGSLNLKFPTLSKVLNPQHELDVEAYLREQDSLAALLDSLQDSTQITLDIGATTGVPIPFMKSSSVYQSVMGRSSM